MLRPPNHKAVFFVLPLDITVAFSYDAEAVSVRQTDRTVTQAVVPMTQGLSGRVRSDVPPRIGKSRCLHTIGALEEDATDPQFST